MIKVVYEYRIELEFQEELFNKFKQSTDSKFRSVVSNVGIKMFKRVNSKYLYVVLDIYYNSFEEYQIRYNFEQANDEWINIWFDKDSNHEELSVTVYDVIN